jgi:hypothetical protein
MPACGPVLRQLVCLASHSKQGDEVNSLIPAITRAIRHLGSSPPLLSFLIFTMTYGSADCGE